MYDIDWYCMPYIRDQKLPGYIAWLCWAMRIHKQPGWPFVLNRWQAKGRNKLGGWAPNQLVMSFKHGNNILLVESESNSFWRNSFGPSKKSFFGAGRESREDSGGSLFPAKKGSRIRSTEPQGTRWGPPKPAIFADLSLVIPMKTTMVFHRLWTWGYNFLLTRGRTLLVLYRSKWDQTPFPKKERFWNCPPTVSLIYLHLGTKLFPNGACVPPGSQADYLTYESP